MIISQRRDLSRFVSLLRAIASRSSLRSRAERSAAARPPWSSRSQDDCYDGSEPVHSIWSYHRAHRDMLARGR
eukprot:5221477-Pyramimonas_sp.AAC.1